MHRQFLSQTEDHIRKSKNTYLTQSSVQINVIALTIRSQVPGLSVHVNSFFSFLKLYFLNSPIQSSPLNSLVQRWLKRSHSLNFRKHCRFLTSFRLKVSVGIPLLVLHTMSIEGVDWSPNSRRAHRTVICIQTITAITPKVSLLIIAPIVFH